MFHCSYSLNSNVVAVVSSVYVVMGSSVDIVVHGLGLYEGVTSAVHVALVCGVESKRELRVLGIESDFKKHAVL